MCIQNQDVRNVALVVLLDQLLLLGRALNVKVDDHKENRGTALIVQFNRTTCFPLGVKASFAVHDDVIGLARNKSRLSIRSGDEWTVDTITTVVEVRIEFQVIDCKQSSR